jgi:hypothetical protein
VVKFFLVAAMLLQEIRGGKSGCRCRRLFSSDRHRPKVRIVFPFDVLLAFVSAVERGIGIDPGDDLDELFAADPGLAGLLANPLDHPASM